MDILTETPRAIHQFLNGFKPTTDAANAWRDCALYAPAGEGGRHQVTYLGKHGDFHIYSAVNVHDPDEGTGTNPELAAAADPAALKAHLSKVHTLAEITALNAKARAWSDAHDTGGDLVHPPHIPVFYDHHLHGYTGSDPPTIVAAAHEATQQLRSLGLPSQDRHVVLYDQSDRVNNNTGQKGDVGGHWDARNHVIAVNRKGSWSVGTGDHLEGARILTHEWAHAYHDEMGKPQRAAWKDFYQRHVVKTSSPTGTEEDRAGYAQAFSDHFLNDPNVKSFQSNLRSRANYGAANADMMQSEHRSTPEWWEGMLTDNHLDSGVVAQSSHTLRHSADDKIGLKKGVIKKNSYVVVRNVDPAHPRDQHMLAKNLWQKEDAPHLLAVHPVGHPEKLAIIHRTSLLRDASAGSKFGTYLHVDPKRTADMSDELVRGAFKRGGDVLAGHGHLADAAESYRHSQEYTGPPQKFPMTQRWKDEGEVQGSDHKTVDDYVRARRARGAVNLHVAADAAHEAAQKKFPGVLHMGVTTGHFVDRVLDHVASGTALPHAVASAVKYNTIAKPAMSDFIGSANASYRADAATKGTALNSYGASNDRELFATTVEHLARMKRQHAPGGILNRMPATARKTIKAFGASIRGERLPEGIVAQIDELLRVTG